MNKKQFPQKEDLLDAIMKGLLTAKENFSLWCGEKLYLSYAPANFLTIHVAQEIAKVEEFPEIFIDASISETLKYGLPSTEEYKSFMQKFAISDRIFSLTLDERFDHETKQDSIARAIISVKNGVRNLKDEYINDIESMSKVISHSKMDYAIFAFYLDISDSARIKAETRITEIINEFNTVTGEYENLNSYFIGGDVNIIENIGEWSIGCYVIEKNNKEEK